MIISFNFNGVLANSVIKYPDSFNGNFIYLWNETDNTHGTYSFVNNVGNLTLSSNYASPPYGDILFIFNNTVNGITIGNIYPIVYTYSVNISQFSSSLNSLFAYFGLANASVLLTYNNFTITGGPPSANGVYFYISSSTALDFGYYNNSAWTQLNSSAYSIGKYENLTIVMNETSNNNYIITAYVNSTVFYNNTLYLSYNYQLMPIIAMSSLYVGQGIILNTFMYSIGCPYVILSSVVFHIFSGFVGTIISNIWTTFQALPLYISQTITEIVSGLPKVISSITTYIQCIITQVSQVVTKIYSGIVNYLSSIHILFKVGYKTGIAYITIYILNPLKTAISQVVFSIQTGIINYISTITTYLQNSGIIPPNASTLPVSYLVVLFILLIPAILIRYISNMLVLPMFDFMAIVCFLGGQISVFSLIFIIIASIPLMLNSEGDEL